MHKTSPTTQNRADRAMHFFEPLLCTFYLTNTDYQKYISEETMMGPSCLRILDELLKQCPLKFTPDDSILDLGCGRGLTSLIIAKETGAKVYANDLWINADENKNRFIKWGIDRQIISVCEDANNLHFGEKQFSAMFSIDAYHYFAGNKGFFENKIMPFIKDSGIILIGIPGIKDKFEGFADNLLSDWLGEDSHMFKSPKLWKEIIGNNNRIASVRTWEMECFDIAWSEWFAIDNDFANGDKKYFDSIIKPYTCFVGIEIKLR